MKKLFPKGSWREEMYDCVKVIDEFLHSTFIFIYLHTFIFIYSKIKYY